MQKQYKINVNTVTKIKI